MAARFWVGGSGTWDASDTTHWSLTAGGAGGQSVPGSADDVTIDSNAAGLNGGTITVNTNPSIVSLTMNTMTGTLDFATNNNSITVSGATGVTSTGTTTRAINMGNGTWTLSNNAATWNFTTVTGLTFTKNSSTIAFTGTGGTTARRFIGGGLSYNTVTVSGGASAFIISGTNTFATLTLAGAVRAHFPPGVTTTVTTFTSIISGSGSTPIFLGTDAPLNGIATISSANNFTVDYGGLQGITFTGGGTFAATNSYNFGNNLGITITAPTVGGGVVGVIGG